MKVRHCILLIIVMSIGACGEDSGPVDAPQVPEPTLDEQVMANCLAVQAAAEAYASRNDGEYRRGHPIRELIPFLPDSTLLANPVTGELSEPFYREPSGIGSTSYYVYGMYDWETNRPYSVGYYIVGRCEDYDIIITNVPDSVIQIEQMVIDNCLKVHQAAEAFAADNGGVFPSNNGHINPIGKTIQDYLPNGRLLQNPYYYYLPTEPQWGIVAGNPGQTGYVSMDTNGDGEYNAYRIDGMGPWYYELLFDQIYHLP